jgi:mannose-1-phosphate guanylyltransferase
MLPIPNWRTMYAVIMAGGVGTRFWPRSRRQRPKQLLPISGAASMIRLTVDRLKPLLHDEQILVVTGADQADAIRAELPEIPADNILVEPVGRNTAPCIGLAAHVLRCRGAASDTMVVLAADHVIQQVDEFQSVLAACDALLQQQDQLVTLGIKPHRAETGYGYIRKGRVAAEASGRTFRQVDRFLEKPDAPTAERLVADGNHLWNSGMFLWRVERIIQEIGQHLPEIAAGLQNIEDAWGTPERQARLQSEYEAFQGISIDYGVMERAEQVAVLEVDFGWSDVGSWASLTELRRADGNGNVLPAEALAMDASGNIVDVQGKTVVLLGVEDLIIVEEEDALLVCHRDRAQQVGRIPEKLREMGKASLT